MKNQLFRFFVASFLLLVSSIKAEIVEITHFSEIKNYIDKDTLILLDIDDTLLIPTQMLGCDNWFKELFKKHNKKHLSSYDFHKKVFFKWEAIRLVSEMKLVEKDSDKIIKDLQNKGFCIIALTSQSICLSPYTLIQLKDNNINLSITAPKEGKYFPCINDKDILYKSGVLFTSGSPKGESLFKFLDEIKYHPKKIILVDDHKPHLESVEKVTEEKGIKFIGLRYGYSDIHKNSYNTKIAEYQFLNSTFDHIISDEEAKLKLKNN